MPAPPMPFVPAEYHGQFVTLAMILYTGDVAEGLRVVAPFRALAEPIVDMIGPMPYPDIYWPEDPDSHAVFSVRSKFIDRVDEHTARIMLEQLHAVTSGMPIAEFRVLGGAMARVPPEATAFAHRLSKIMASFIVQYEDRDEAPIQDAWATKALAALEQGAGAVYVNFVGNEDRARIHDAYPDATWQRLAAIKAKYDPTNLFHRNQNIPPKIR